MSFLQPWLFFKNNILWDLHKSNSKYKSYKSVCPCIYGIDEVTLIELIKEKISSHEVIKIETRK